ncbi:cAMP-regulated phosphoprotein 19-like [Clytia hemisphaerica]|uniref:cAMP-regulated phosphoprotein 19 n=1 Tax=Clytia hemisphaerica TaxID=252671 RepID=A0A7M5XBE5_9CNID|eukprot:TCONS_00066387-protein
MSTMATFKGPQELPEAERFKQKFPQGAPRQSDFLRKRLQGKGGAKYFDSGDYNMAKSTHGRNVPTGKAIPTPENLPQRKISSTKQSNLIEGGTSPPQSALPEEKAVTEGEQHKSKQHITEQE